MLSKRLIGIDIGSRDVKLVELRKSGDRVHLTVAQQVPLPDNGADLTTKMASAEEALRSFLTPRRRVPVVCSIPPQDATEKVVDLPPTDPDTVDDLMRYEAETHIPLPMDAVNYDHVLVRADPDGASVLLTACPRHVPTALADVLQKAGARLYALETPCVALLNALRQATPEEVLTGASGLLLVDVGARHTQIVVIAHGQPRLVRSVPIGGEGLTEALAQDGALSPEEAEARKREQGVAVDELTPAVQAWLQRLTDELRRVAQGFRATTRTGAVERILLTGGGALTRGLAERLTELVGVPTQLLSPNEAVTTGVGSFAAAGDEGVRFATAIGLALSANSSALVVNLLPEERSLQFSRVLPRPLMLGIIASVIAAVIMVTAGLRSLSTDQKERLALLQGELRHLQARFQDTSSSAEAQKRAEALKGLESEVRGDATLWLNVLRDLSAQLPPNVSVTEIIMEKQRTVYVRGMADTNTTVADSLRVIRSLRYFTDVRLDYASESKVEGQSVVEFQVVCRLPAPVERRRPR